MYNCINDVESHLRPVVEIVHHLESVLCPTDNANLICLKNSAIVFQCSYGSNEEHERQTGRLVETRDGKLVNFQLLGVEHLPKLKLLTWTSTTAKKKKYRINIIKEPIRMKCR